MNDRRRQIQTRGIRTRSDGPVPVTTIAGMVMVSSLVLLSAACGQASENELTTLGGPVSVAREAISPSAAPATEQGAGGLTWSVPESWVELPPSSAMRKAQYQVPGPAGDAECVVFYFGPGQGGDADANARRWIEQFDAPDGGPADDGAVVAKRTVGDLEVTVVEVSGTYVGGMGPAMGGSTAQPGQMLLGAIAPGPGANWFFKLLGPRETVESQRDPFTALIDSLQVGTPAS